MKCRTVFDLPRLPRVPGLSDTIPAGTVIDHTVAVKLAEAGVADPEDEECRTALTRTAEQIAAARAAYYRDIVLGIHPSDREKYEAGEMVGYDENGDSIPGPNAVPEDEPETDDTDYADW